MFPDLAEKGLKTVRASYPDKVDVSPERTFSGFDAYKQAIDLADVVILATPPGFRPVHLAYAVEKGRHVFMEKPHAVDAAGARSVIESAKLARSKNLGLVSGFCYRYDPFKRETMKRVHGGEIGAVHAVHSQFLTGELWTRASKTNDPKEMEYQLRMWYYFTWLSGDFIVEQACHNIDKIAWAMNGKLPIAATGLGGRQVRTDEKFGNIWDHFAVVYEFEDDAKAFLHCRQHNKTQSNTVDTIYGTGGSAQLMKHTTNGKSGKWAHPGVHDFGQMYQQEHDELFASIRAGKPLNDGVASAHSTLIWRFSAGRRRTPASA